VEAACERNAAPAPVVSQIALAAAWWRAACVPRAVASALPGCAFTAEELATFGHSGGAFPGLTAIRTELLHRDANDRPGFTVPPAPGPVDCCSGYEVFGELPFAAAGSNSDADLNRSHSDLLLAFRTTQAASEVIRRLVAAVQTVMAAAPDPERRLELLDAPTLGEERLVGKETELSTVTSADGAQREEPNMIQYDVGFRRGPVLILSDDVFSPDAADFALALSLAEAIDTRIAAALQ